MSNAMFAVPILDGFKPIPLAQRQKRRVIFGDEIRIHLKRNDMTINQLLTRSKLSHSFVSDLLAGKETGPTCTVFMLHRLAAGLSCELVLKDDNGEQNHGATTTMEELLRIGITPTLNPVD